MNTEYAKFGEPREEYNPPVAETGHFSHVPDLLIPADYTEVVTDPLEREENEVILQTPTPPPTPPELEPGLAGCNVFKEVHYYVDPVYEDEAYARVFIAKLLFLDTIHLALSAVLLMVICAWRWLDLVLLENATLWFIINGFGFALMFAFIYVSNLLRNPPYVYIAFVTRSIISTLTVGFGCVTIHILFLQTFYSDSAALAQNTLGDEDHDHDSSQEEEITSNDEFVKLTDRGFAPSYSPPYMGLLLILICTSLKLTLGYIYIKFEINPNDYRVPVIVYTVCFIISPFLLTAALNNAFKSDPVGYDFVQIVVGTFLSCALIMRIGTMSGRLLGGKICPLREGELFYAACHFGM